MVYKAQTKPGAMMVEFTEVQKTLTRKNSLRAAVRPLGLELVDKMIADLHEIRDDLELEELERKEQEQARQKKIEEARKLLAEMGVAPEEVAGVAVADKPRAKRRRAPARPKYKLGDVTWAGRGRAPLDIQKYLDEGGKLTDLLIDKPADKSGEADDLAKPEIFVEVHDKGFKPYKPEQEDRQEEQKKEVKPGLLGSIMGRH